MVAAGCGIAMVSCGSDDPGPPAEVPLTGTLPPRPTERSCDFDGHPPGVLPQLAVEEVNIAADLVAPIAMLPAPDGSADVLVLERDGSIWRMSPPDEDDAAPSAVRVLDAQPTIGEGLSLATSPAQPSHVVVAWQTTGGVTRVSRLTLASTIDPASERVIMSSSTASGAAVSFDDDGLLYVTFGDSTDDASASVDAQDHTTVEGTVSRVDITPIDATGTFAVPPSNPNGTAFGGAAEPVATWALGVRSAGACTVAGGASWCSDLGAAHSEVHRVRAGSDLGWPDYDGATCLVPNGCPLELERLPQATVPRTSGCGIVGVQGYAGTRFPSLDPALVYADSCARGVHVMLLASPDENLWNKRLLELSADVTGVGRDAAGEVYALGPGVLWRVVVPQEDAPFPTRLSDAGCFDDVPSLAPSAGVVPYDVNAALWTDGSDKRRFIELPPGETITLTEDGAWSFPVGTVVLKTFSYEVGPVEIRAMILRPHGWEFHSYRYDDALGDAVLLDDSDERLLGPTLAHDFPSRWTCTVCHRVDDARVLAIRGDQLNRVTQYTDGPNEQLVAMSAIGMFDAELDVDVTPRMAQPFDTKAPLEQRARAYLHTNCAHCHQPGGWVPPNMEMDLRYTTTLAETAACDVPSRFGMPGTLIAAGDPDGSRILERMRTTGNQRMPPVATGLVDGDGTAVVAEWIASLEGCP